MKFLGLIGTNIASGDAYAKQLESHHEAVLDMYVHVTYDTDPGGTWQAVLNIE